MVRSSKTQSDKIEEIASKFAKLNGAPRTMPRPDNCVTVVEYAEYAKIAESTAWKWLHGLHKKGLAKRHKYGKAFCYELNEIAKK
tara:strand:- start:934 stop:1188 length:255 start_codon:yes stop_codon:yes gene_type:complete